MDEQEVSLPIQDCVTYDLLNCEIVVLISILPKVAYVKRKEFFSCRVNLSKSYRAHQAEPRQYYYRDFHEVTLVVNVILDLSKLEPRLLYGHGVSSIPWLPTRFVIQLESHGSAVVSSIRFIVHLLSVE